MGAVQLVSHETINLMLATMHEEHLARHACSADMTSHIEEMAYEDLVDQAKAVNLSLAIIASLTQIDDPAMYRNVTGLPRNLVTDMAWV